MADKDDFHIVATFIWFSDSENPKMAAEWKQGLFNCCGDCGICKFQEIIIIIINERRPV